MYKRALNTVGVESLCLSASTLSPSASMITLAFCFPEVCTCDALKELNVLLLLLWSSGDGDFKSESKSKSNADEEVP